MSSPSSSCRVTSVAVANAMLDVVANIDIVFFFQPCAVATLQLFNKVLTCHHVCQSVSYLPFIADARISALSCLKHASKPRVRTPTIQYFNPHPTSCMQETSGLSLCRTLGPRGVSCHHVGSKVDEAYRPDLTWPFRTPWGHSNLWDCNKVRQGWDQGLCWVPSCCALEFAMSEWRAANLQGGIAPSGRYGSFTCLAFCRWRLSFSYYEGRGTKLVSRHNNVDGFLPPHSELLAHMPREPAAPSRCPAPS